MRPRGWVSDPMPEPEQEREGTARGIVGHIDTLFLGASSKKNKYWLEVC